MTNHLKFDSIISNIGTSVASMEKLRGGFSHEAWRVSCSDGRQVVVRFGEANSSVEATALNLAKTVVPAPNVLSSGDGCIVLEFIEGDTLEDVLLCCDPNEDLDSLAIQLGHKVAAIGSIEFARPGFFHNDRLEPSNEDPWSQQLAIFCADTLETSGRFTALEAAAWLNLCEQNSRVLKAVDTVSRLVHSDLNPKNVIVKRVDDDWQIAAIIDWEFAYSGCPFADVGNFCRFPADYPAGFLAAFIKVF